MAGAWYKEGKVSVTTGLGTVTGTGANFIANVRTGDGFKGPDGAWYEITNIFDDTHIAIYPTYGGPSVTDASFLVAPLQGYVKESADRLRRIVDQYGDILSILGDANLIASVASVQADATGNIPTEALAQALGLPLLQPKEAGKGLSQEDFTTLLKASLEQLPGRVTSLEEGKVDKIAGKGLSTNDFTGAEQQKLAALESSRFKGEFTELAALQSAIPTGSAGDYARLDAGAGSDVETALWDTTDSKWVKRASEGGPMPPAEIKESYESNPNTNAFTDADKSKLAGIANGATQNATDAALRDRSTHTGQQLASTISDLAAAVRAVVLTGLSTGTQTPILATDGTLTAFGKLQAQINRLVTVTASAGVNGDIHQLIGLTTPLSVSQGGTGGGSQTAAQAALGLVKVASPTDSTAGRLLTVGAHGVGDLAPQIQATSLNALRTSGTYYALTSGGQGPLPVLADGYIFSQVYATTYAIQKYTNATTGKEYKRKLVAGVWDAAWEDVGVGGGGLAVGSVVAWKFNRATIPGGQLPHDGQIVTNGRTLYPEFWALIEPFTVTDVEWLAAPYTSRGMFSKGNGSTDFRMPDDNAKHPDGLTIAAMVLRGDGKNSTGTPGLHQADQMQQITGTLEIGATIGSIRAAGTVAGAFKKGASVGNIINGSAGAAFLTEFDSAGSPDARTGTETRSANSTVIWCTVVAKTAVNTGTVDVTVLSNTVGQQGTAIDGKQGKPFVSALLPITSAGSLTISHGLSSISNVSYILECITAEQGFTVGQRVPDSSVNSGSQGTAATARGVTLSWKLAGDITAKFSSSGQWALPSPTSGSVVSISAANWKIEIRVYP